MTDVEPTRALRSLWAKSPAEGQLPLELTTHLADACEVATIYWESFVAPRFRASLVHVVGGDEALALRLVRWLAAAHDTGKATPSFAGQVPTLRDRVEAGGLPLLGDPRANGELRHDLAGAVLWFERLRTRGWTDEVAWSYALVIAGHHGTYPDAGMWSKAEKDTYCTGRRDPAWRSVQHEVMDRVERIAGIGDDDFAALAGRRLPATVQLELTGLVIHSDWIASDAERFPLGRTDAPEVPDTRTARERAESAWADLGLPGPWHPVRSAATPDSVYRARFQWPGDRSPRPVQQRALELAREASPGLMVIEAPMGVGKTEAALAVAEEWGARSGCSGIYFALPTMATSDAMFARILPWSGRVPGTGEASVYLAHSKRQFNGAFADLPRTDAPRTAGGDPPGDGEGSDDDRHASVAEWLTGRRRGIAANVVVGTVDHVLMLALRSRYGMLRHAALAGKVVVVDEVHASDTRMLFFLEGALEWLAAYGVPVVLLSATLTAAIRERLVAAFERGARARRRSFPVGELSAEPKASPRPRLKRARTRGLEGMRPEPTATTSLRAGPVVYPLISIADGNGGRRTDAPATTGAPETDVRFETLGDDSAHLLELLRERTTEGGCVLVVRNTVRRAIELYDALRVDPVLGGDVVLAHSRFIGPHRSENDAALVERFGPPIPGRRRPGCDRPAIVVATQVAEMSLDVDFDLLVSDLAPIDAVLQRVGRLHRHERADRPGSLARPTCVLTGVVDWTAEPIEPVAPAVRVYERAALLRAAVVLAPHLGRDAVPVRLPADIGELVEAAGRPGLDVPAAWHAVITQADEAAANARQDSERRAAHWRIPAVEQTESLIGFSHGAIDDRAEQLSLATVRDGEDSFEVLLLRPGSTVGTVRTMPTIDDPDGRSVSTDFLPPPAVAKVVAAGALRLPSWLCVAKTGQQVIDALERSYYPAWEASPFLRGQLLLELDGDDRAELAGVELHYTRERGLEVIRASTS